MRGWRGKCPGNRAWCPVALVTRAPNRLNYGYVRIVRPIGPGVVRPAQRVPLARRCCLRAMGINWDHNWDHKEYESMQRSQHSQRSKKGLV